MGKKGKKKAGEQKPGEGQQGEAGPSAGPSTAQQPPQQQQQQKQKGQKKGQQPQQTSPEQPTPPPQQQQQQRPPQQQQQQPRPPQQQHQAQQQQRPPQQQQQRPPQQQQWRPQQSWGPQSPPHTPGQMPPGFQPQAGFRQQRPRGPSPGQFGPPQPHWGPPGQQPVQQPMGGPRHRGSAPQQQYQQQQQRGPPPQQQYQQQPQQQQQRGPPPQQQYQQAPQQQQRGPPPGMAPPQVPPPQAEPPQQRQQQQKQQQPRGRPQQQQQQSGPSPQPPSQAQSPQSSTSPASPPFGGQGDCLKQLALVNPGTKGRKIRVESNHLSLNLGSITEAVHYDVAITPDTPKCLLREVLRQFGRKHYPSRHPAFDGRKNLYSPVMLPFGDTNSISDTVKVEGENGAKEFKVEIKFARMVDLTPLHDMLKTKQSPQDALQCLDIVLRSAPALNCIIAGRCFFTPPKDQIINLGDGMEMYYGFYQSAIRGWKPLLNVDVAHKAFPKSVELLDLILELGSDYRYQMRQDELNKPLNEYLIRNLEKFLKQLKVKYEIRGQSSSKRIHRVNGLGLPPSKAQFKLDDGKVMTVAQYFETTKRTRLQFPHLPTIWVGSRERENKILLPLEFCSLVEGQVTNRKMNENQTSAMIKQAATSTDVRKDKIMKSLDKVRYNSDPCIQEFGFSVNNKFEELDARVLEPPSLLYANNAVVKPSKGVWRADNARFLIPATINQWTIASATRQPARGLEKLADMVQSMSRNTGMQIANKATPPFGHIGGRQTLRDFVEFFKSKQGFDLIFVVVPNSGPQYSYVKQAAELNVGCLTQCIKERTLFKLNPQTVINILLKVNSKMNGTNHAFHQISRPPIMSRPCMIMGADVTHPSPDAKDIPSVAAVTASHDPKAFQYNICWRLQPPKVEIIEDLCNITMEQLMFFYKKNHCKPERIVFFRDGVSEGQFEQVQRAEISAIQKACKKLQADGYEPLITFLVVQKRHHTRLFPLNPRDSEDRNKNVPAGTCVDTVITNPVMQDFYLVSHASIQGVAKPTKYCTLWDDNKMSHDDMEALTYHLCHMFTRCNRSVSYPAPTYYAHLAAARAKVYIENDKLNMANLKKHQESYKILDCIVKEKPMFFV